MTQTLTKNFSPFYYLKNVKKLYRSCTILGDKKYLSVDNLRNLFFSNQITLEIPIRKNQHEYKPQAYIFRKSKKTYQNSFLTTL